MDSTSHNPRMLSIQLADAVAHEIPILAEIVASSTHWKNDRAASIIATFIRKSAEDLAASCLLVRTGMCGPANVLNRAVREQGLRALYIATATQSRREEFVEFYDKATPARAALRLEQIAAKALTELDDILEDTGRRRLEALTLNPDKREQANTFSALSTKIPSLSDSALSIARKINELDWAPTGFIGTQYIDYWLECEAVHGSTRGLDSYGIHNKKLIPTTEKNYQLLYTALNLRDLLLVLMLAVSAETSQVGSLTPTDAAIYRERLKNEAEIVLLSHWKSDEL